MKDESAKKAFAKAAYLKPSRAWSVFGRYCGKAYADYGFYRRRPEFYGIPGADHACVWRREKQYLITTEPYKSAGYNHESLEKFCRENRWELLKSRHPGWWNPPHTELWLLSPPFIGLSVYAVEADLLYSQHTREMVGANAVMLAI